MMRACVIGDPISHSRSPLVHNFWLVELGIDGAYEARHVTTHELPDFLNALGRDGYRGCNVTLPHKESVARLVDRTTELSRILGAVNTVWVDSDGRLHGDNTDVYGFLANLDQEAPDWRMRTKVALILGAGGAARAVLLALISCGVREIKIVNRTVERATALAAGRHSGIEVLPLERVEAALADVDLLVNTTQLGMVGQPKHAFSLASLKADALVHDIVYVPLETDLMRRARLRGHQTIGGLGMLLHQAVPGFERWFGTRPKVTPALYRHIAADVPATLVEPGSAR